ncbi:hypothetical protein CTI12_AA215540 [Artemisia annua]|uniref:Uncharacterized protein n=1 Tax=Artemisia annua TaxID=35608 RepID=A0A2U1NQR8_ARTAN|nr:hypothetical protein CTI12_AA215540 [Artemisia annua]
MLTCMCAVGISDIVDEHRQHKTHCGTGMGSIFTEYNPFTQKKNWNGEQRVNDLHAFLPLPLVNIITFKNVKGCDDAKQELENMVIVFDPFGPDVHNWTQA